MVGALVAVNSVGSVLMPDGKTYWAWPFELQKEFGGSGPPQSHDGLERSCARRSAVAGDRAASGQAPTRRSQWSRATPT